MGVVFGEVVDDARTARMHIAAAQIFGADFFARGRFYQRWPAQEDRSLFTYDHRLVTHSRYVGASGGARAHDRRDLRDAVGRHPSLIEEDSAEMLAVREHFVLERQERAARVHEVDARKPVFRGDGLSPEVLLDRHRVIGAAFDRGIIGDHHALPSLTTAGTGDNTGA